MSTGTLVLAGAGVLLVVVMAYEMMTPKAPPPPGPLASLGKQVDSLLGPWVNLFMGQSAQTAQGGTTNNLL